jgi:hypothetical protein
MVVGEIRPLPLSTRETVVTDTPANCATSVIVIFLMVITSAMPYQGEFHPDSKWYTESLNAVKRFTHISIVTAKHRS